MSSAGQRMKYPYTITGKMALFPWKHYWTNGRGFRYAIIGLGLCMPFFFKMQKLTNQPANQRQWAEIRAHRLHDHFEPPKE